MLCRVAAIWRDTLVFGASCAPTFRRTLAGYVLGALSAAGGLRSQAAVRRLLTMTLAGLRPPG